MCGAPLAGMLQFVMLHKNAVNTRMWLDGAPSVRHVQFAAPRQKIRNARRSAPVRSQTGSEGPGQQAHQDRKVRSLAKKVLGSMRMGVVRARVPSCGFGAFARLLKYQSSSPLRFLSRPKPAQAGMCETLERLPSRLLVVPDICGCQGAHSSPACRLQTLNPKTLIPSPFLQRTCTAASQAACPAALGDSTDERLDACINEGKHAWLVK